MKQTLRANKHARISESGIKMDTVNGLLKTGTIAGYAKKN